MAKILLGISGLRKENSSESYIFPFYEGFIKSLLRNGNDVYYTIIQDFIVSYISRSNTLKPELDRKALDNYMKDQNFDLVIAFNNALYDGYVQRSDIPYIVWGVDPPLTVYAEKEELKSNSDRYIFCGNNEKDYAEIKSYFSPQKVEILRFATDIRAQNILQDYPISFCGTPWDVPRNISSVLKGNFPIQDIKKMVDLVRKDPSLTLEQLQEKLNLDTSILEKTSTFEFLHSIAGSDRVMMLGSLVDLGLHTFGSWTPRWYDIASCNLPLTLTYDPRMIYDLDSTQDLLNRSRISFNMSHFHAGDYGFSFRVIDSMASNACLVTDEKLGYKKLFGDYVKLPTFKYLDFKGAHDVCEYFLNHEDERLDIVRLSQKAVDANFRFEHRLKQIEDLSGVKLFNSDNDCKKGTLTHIKSEDFLKVGTQVQPSIPSARKLSLKNKIRYKIWHHLDKKLRRKGII